ARMGDLIRELALPQIILVSHEEELAGVADHVVRITKEGGLSKIVGAGETPALDDSHERPRSAGKRRRSILPSGPPAPEPAPPAP
ncbi:MAG: hypothetical protein L3K03_06340, partial [Thermoplasmata archaeon]|nr:hypothetical protein [Thermoplasmata archaeon]